MIKYFRTFSAALLCLLAVGTPAARAAAARTGATAQAIAAPTRASAVAYDSTNKVYLVVGSFGTLRGRFVDAKGTPIGGLFQIQASANFTHFPRVTFSQDADNGAGGFLVTWHESDLPGGNTSVHGRMVSLGKAGAFGTDTVLATEGSWWEAGAAVAYSTASKEFLIAFTKVHIAAGGYGVRAIRVANSAAALGPAFTIARNNQFEDNASVGYNSVTDEFMVVFTGYNDPGRFAFVDSQRVKAGANQLLGGSVRLTQTAGAWITDVTYNAASNTYLAAWFSLPGNAAFGRVLNADGSLNGNIITLSTRYKAYDALSLAYNRRSDTFFMVSHSPTAEDGGVEISSAGTPVDNGFTVTAAGGSGNFYPRLATSSDDPNWLISTANNFTSTVVQLVAGTAAAGTPTTPTTTPPVPPAPPTDPAPPSNLPPPPPTPKPMLNVDIPANNATVPTSGFLIAGWAIDAGSTSTTGVDAVVAWAWPSNGSAAILAGVATLGYSRPDVGAAFGSRFTQAGFGLNASLPAGTYTLTIYAHSTIDGKWADPRVTAITVQAPTSTPRMWIDLPAQNQNLSQNVTVAGWALDLGATNGPGVNAVHVYAYKAGSSTPIFLGVARYGDARPDVGGAFGSSRFNGVGFFLSTTLAPGDYTLVVFARSTVSATFNSSVVSVKVQ